MVRNYCLLFICNREYSRKVMCINKVSQASSTKIFGPNIFYCKKKCMLTCCLEIFKMIHHLAKMMYDVT